MKYITGFIATFLLLQGCASVNTFPTIARQGDTVSIMIDGIGNTDGFLRDTATSGQLPVDFNALEPAPHAKISFGVTDGIVIGAASLVIDFDETVLNPNDIDVYVPQSNVRGSVVDPGAFGETQRMVYWHQNGLQLYIDIIAPQGINQAFSMAYIIHPRGLAVTQISL